MKVSNPIFKVPLKLTKKSVTSGGSRQAFFFKNTFPLNLKYKKLMIKPVYKAGRNNTGRVVVNSKKSKLCNPTRPKVNYNFRTKNLGFIGGFFFIPNINKLASFLMLSSGAITFVPSTTTHELFTLTRFKGITRDSWDFSKYHQVSTPSLYFRNIFATISSLPKNKSICLIEALPTHGIIYSRSPGSSSKIIKMNSLTSTALVKLSSGVKKVFSTHSLASEGKSGLPDQKKCKINKAGFYKSLGKKSKVRGIAKNPVDHPHGGRTKAIKYQRTPWGKTTKFK